MSFEWVVLRNSAAGPSAVPEARVQQALERHGVRATIESPTDPDGMRRSACDAVERGRPIALVGGDGTLSTVVDALADRGIVEDAIVGVLPAGTGCDLIRTFGIPQAIEDAARHLSTPNTYRIDVGRLEGAWGVRHFVNVANAGLAAAVVEASAHLPRKLGSLRYLTAVASAAPGFKACEVELTTPRRTHRQHALMLVAANGQFFGGGWNVAPKALLVDGELDTQLIDVPKTAIPRMLPKLMRGLHLSHPGVRRRSIGEFTFTPELAWPVEVDGDPIGHGSFRATMLPAALELKI
jgi:diacylglycerol kinase (ATP)